MYESKGSYETIRDWLNKIQFIYKKGYSETITNNTIEYCGHGKRLTVFCYAKSSVSKQDFSHDTSFTKISP